MAKWLGVGRTRAKTLLKIMVASGRIAETGTTEMKSYQRVRTVDNMDNKKEAKK